MIYCKKCYTTLPGTSENFCPKCSAYYNSAQPRTHLRRPFPAWPTILTHLFYTTLIALTLAFAVAFHQASSGH